MPVKLFVFLFIAVAGIYSQNQVAISGTVQDSRTNAPVSGARVTLLGMDLTTDTDTEGNFSLSGSSLLQPKAGQKEIASFIDGNGLLYVHENKGQVRIRIFDVSGTLRQDIFSGTLASGVWRITPPQLSPGLYFFTIDTPQSHLLVRYLASATYTGTQAGKVHKLADRTETSKDGLAKYMVSLQPVDSLLVEKSGYNPSNTSLDSYQQTGLTILLEPVSGSDDATIIPDPSWTCFMPDGIPPPELGEEVFSITLEYSAVHDVGLTKFGQRRQFDIDGGSITGDRIQGTVLTGGLDYELTLSNGSMELEQIVILRTNDNTPILMRNAGVAPAGAQSVRVVLDFEAPNSSSYSWLHDAEFAAQRIVDEAAKTIQLDVYDISDVDLTDERIQIEDPPDVEDQTWECFTASGSQGATVFTENVSLGGSISIGATKRGSRNIIPITGGTTSGRVTGSILSGGADYQLGGLDARYTLHTNDDEFIIIRNCGAGALIPVFEARVDGPYDFLNENKYLSSAPGMGTGGVTITFYERQ